MIEKTSYRIAKQQKLDFAKNISKQDIFRRKNKNNGW